VLKQKATMDLDMSEVQLPSFVTLKDKENLLTKFAYNEFSGGDSGTLVSNMNTSALSCTWTGCANKSFTRKSDLRYEVFPDLVLLVAHKSSGKHLDKHTKPYVCEELGCNRLTFGDKAGLRRHEAEKHGKHDATRYFCSVTSCPRAQKGFPRKQNRDAHVSTRHVSQPAVGSEVSSEGSISATPELSERLGSQDATQGKDEYTVDKMHVLRVKLEELEKEKKELAKAIHELNSRQSRVDEDVRILKRTMQLVAE
jgi:hypothetical protein